MEKIEWTYSQVVGRAGQHYWSQVMVFPQSQIRVGEKNPRAMLWVAFSVEIDESDSEKGAELVEAFEERFGQGLPETAKEIFGSLQEIMEGYEVELSGLLVVDGRAYLLGWNTGEIALMRKGNVGVVLRSEKGAWAVKQGVVLVGDRWLVGTRALIEEMEDEFLGEVLTEKNAEDAGQSLAMRVQADDESEGVAGLLVYVNEASHADATDSSFRKEKKLIRVPDVRLRQNDYKGKRSKTAFSVGVILLLLLGVSLYFGWRQRLKQQDEAVMVSLQEEVNKVVEQAPLLAKVDRIQAEGKVEEVLRVVDAGREKLHDREAYDAKVDELKQKLSTLKQTVSGRMELTEVELWYSLSLLSDGMMGKAMTRVGDSLYVLGDGQPLVAKIDLVDKQGEIAAGGDLLLNATELGGSENRLVAVAGGVLVEIDPVRKNTAEIGRIKSSRVYGLSMFGDTIYTVEGDDLSVLRYADIDSPTDWLKPGETVGIAQVADMDIDGDIWILGQSGKVARFRRGVREEFAIGEVDGELSELVAIEVADENDKVFLLDRGNKRIVMFNKSGTYLEQYVWSGLSAASDFVFDESRNRLLVLVGGEIYEILLGS